MSAAHGSTAAPGTNPGAYELTPAGAVPIDPAELRRRLEAPDGGAHVYELTERGRDALSPVQEHAPQEPAPPAADPLHRDATETAVRRVWEAAAAELVRELVSVQYAGGAHGSARFKVGGAELSAADALLRFRQDARRVLALQTKPPT